MLLVVARHLVGILTPEAPNLSLLLDDDQLEIAAMRFSLLFVLATVAPAPVVRAIVVSDFVGSHVVNPGTPAFGVNLDGVVQLTMADGFAFASGALISDRHVLSVAHAVDLDVDGKVEAAETAGLQVVFHLPAGSVSVGVETALVPQLWTDLLMADDEEGTTYDIAVLSLDADAPASAPRYALYGRGDEIGAPVVVAGYGDTGHGSVGMDTPAIGLLAGLNRYEVDSEEFFFGELPPHLLLSDFDSGLEENNALDWLGIPSDLGFGADEVAAVEGDSGGPVFLSGAIAGVTSSGFGELPTDVTNETDGSWGEVSIDSRVSFYRDFLMTATGGQAHFLPEPSGWVLATLLLSCVCSRQARR